VEKKSRNKIILVTFAIVIIVICLTVGTIVMTNIKDEKEQKEIAEWEERNKRIVPNVVGMTRKEAIEELEKNELAHVVSPYTIIDNNAIVTSQSPKAGEKAKKGDWVTIYFKSDATDNNKSQSSKVSINDIDTLAPNERLVANCAYSYLTSFSFMRDSLSKGKSQIISVEVLEKDNYGRYITEFVINEPFNSNYNIDRKHWVILWNIKEDGSFNYNTFKSYFTNQSSTLDMAKNNSGWNKPLN